MYIYIYIYIYIWAITTGNIHIILKLFRRKHKYHCNLAEKKIIILLINVIIYILNINKNIII